ncbi:MAG: hypothetical protein AB1521_07255 [Bacteroidota bacterium]
MRKKKIINSNKEEAKKDTIYCTECGEDLKMFGIDSKKVDLSKATKRFQQCKKTGKFKGDKCAMIFIAESNEDLLIDE